MEVTSQLAQNLEAMAPFYTGQDSEAEAEQDFRPVPADYVITQVENTAICRILQKKKRLKIRHIYLAHVIEQPNFRIPNPRYLQKKIVLIFLMILRTHFKASLRFRKN